MSKRNPFGYSCPKCGSIEINISASTPCTVRLRAGKLNGGGYDYEQDNGPEWEDNDGASCIACGWDGMVGKLIYDGLGINDEGLDNESNAD